MSNVTQAVRVAIGCALLWVLSVVPAAAQRISAQLQTSEVRVTNDIADATFKVVVYSEEAVALTDVWLVFEDGFEISVGDVDGESSKSSDDQTKSFDLSKDGGTAHVPFQATVKYRVDGEPLEKTITVVLNLDQ